MPTPILPPATVPPPGPAPAPSADALPEAVAEAEPGSDAAQPSVTAMGPFTAGAAAARSALQPSPLLPISRPAFVPMITDAPSLNWAGPGDAWSRAWGMSTQSTASPVPGTFGTASAAPSEQTVEPGAIPGPQALPPMPTRPPTLVPQAAVAVVSLAGRGAASAGPTAEDIALVRRSLAILEPVSDRATAHFYAVLFLRHPELRALFPASMDVQRDRLFRALLAAGQAADDGPALSAYLDGLARGHRKYGVANEHYGPVGEALLAALERYCGHHWDQATEIAWRRIYRAVSEVMMASAEDDARSSPAFWQAEVLSVDARTPDIAEVALRTDQPYPYRAGQYTTLEVPLWPRVWRNYSLATAPRDDGTVSLQVKAVPAGWVSNALVHRTRPGDVLRMGPAGGTMVVDHDSDRPVLLVGGGTGIAPVVAMVEEIAAHGRPRTVEVFYGARRTEDLYAREQLRALAELHPWLAVRFVVAEGTTAGGDLCGTLPPVVGRRGPWEEYEAYLSGPPAMIRRASAMLAEEGVPAVRIHHDLQSL